MPNLCCQNGLTQGCPDPEENLHFITGVTGTARAAQKHNHCSSEELQNLPRLGASLAVKSLVTALVCFQPLYREKDLFLHVEFLPVFPGFLSYVPPCESSCLCCLAGTTEHSLFQECLWSSSRASPGSVGRRIYGNDVSGRPSR